MKPKYQNAMNDFDVLKGTVPGKRARISVTGYTDTGFEIDNLLVQGSVVLLPTCAFLWKARTAADITVPSLAIVTVLHPVPELLLLGVGRTSQPVHPSVIEFFARRGTMVEIMQSIHAVTTFDVLMGEDRSCVAAILPFDAPDRHADPFFKSTD